MNAREVRKLGELARRAREVENVAREVARVIEDAYREAAADWSARRKGDEGVRRAMRELKGKWLRMAVASEKRDEWERARSFRAFAQQLDDAILAARDTPPHKGHRRGVGPKL